VLAFVALVMIGRPVIYLAALAPRARSTARDALAGWRGSDRAGSRRSARACSPYSRERPMRRRLFQIASLVVLVSIALHGRHVDLARARRARRARSRADHDRRAARACARTALVLRPRRRAPPDEQYAESDERAHGAVRLSPKDRTSRARGGSRFPRTGGSCSTVRVPTS
jgi:hypothetical protein